MRHRRVPMLLRARTLGRARGSMPFRPSPAAPWYFNPRRPTLFEIAVHSTWCADLNRQEPFRVHRLGAFE